MTGSYTTLTMGIITIINSFDPEIIAIGGGVAKAGDFLMDALLERSRSIYSIRVHLTQR